ncbi:hypothetical protein [Aceticella autotrophica]|nr:hypothetical protein [Aceticella autotrophica]
MLNDNKDKIKNVHYFVDDRLELNLNGDKVTFEEAFKGLPLKQVD